MIDKVKTNYHMDLADVKAHLRLDSDFTDDDGYIVNLIESVVEIAENYINKDIAKTTNTLIFKDFSGDEFIIGEGNYISVTSITDSDSNTYTVDELRVYYDRFAIELTESTPETDLTVIFESGYDTGKLPTAIRQAIMVGVADMYDMGRTGYIPKSIMYNPVFESLLNFYQIQRFIHYPEQ